MLPSTDPLGNPIPAPRHSRQLITTTVKSHVCTCHECPAHSSIISSAHRGHAYSLGSAPSAAASTLPFVPAIVSLIEQLTQPNTSSQQEQSGGGDRRIAGVRASTIRDTAICAVCAVGCYRMFACCCLPVHKCATILSVFDTVIVAMFAYNIFKHLLAGQTDWLIVLSFLFCTAFLICQLIGTVFICLAPKKKIAHYCWPRLVLVTGLLICGTIALIVMAVYFSGQSAGMNNALFAVYEFFFESDLTAKEKEDLKHELKYYAGAFFALCIAFVLYTLFELLLLRKMYNQLKDRFDPVSTQEPTAPPAFNPEFGKA